MDVYPAVKRLAKTVGYDFTFPAVYTRRSAHIAYPEVQLVALVIVVAKHFYPFDDHKQTPRSAVEPTSLIIDWKSWNAAQEKFELQTAPGTKIGSQRAVELKEQDVFQLSASELDDYMDWYQQTWVETSRRFTKGI